MHCEVFNQSLVVAIEKSISISISLVIVFTIFSYFQFTLLLCQILFPCLDQIGPRGETESDTTPAVLGAECIWRLPLYLFYHDSFSASAILAFLSVPPSAGSERRCQAVHKHPEERPCDTCLSLSPLAACKVQSRVDFKVVLFI